MMLLRLPKLWALPTSGWRANDLRRGAMAIYRRQKNHFMDFTFHFMDRVSFSTGFWGFGESMNELNGKLLLPPPENVRP